MQNMTQIGALVVEYTRVSLESHGTQGEELNKQMWATIKLAYHEYIKYK